MKTIAGTIDDFLRLAALNSAHTGRAYKAALRHHFLTFLHEAYELAPEREPAELTLEHARQFAIWLVDLTSPSGQPLSEASRALYLRALTRYYGVSGRDLHGGDFGIWLLLLIIGFFRGVNGRLVSGCRVAFTLDSTITRRTSVWGWLIRATISPPFPKHGGSIRFALE